MKKIILILFSLLILSSCWTKDSNKDLWTTSWSWNKTTITTNKNKINPVKAPAKIKISRKSKNIEIKNNWKIDFCSYKFNIPELMSEFKWKGYQLNDENNKIHDYIEIENKDNIWIYLYPRILNADLLTYTMSNPKMKERFEEIYIKNEHTYNKYINNIEIFDNTNIFDIDPDLHENYFSWFEFIENLNSEKVWIAYFNFAWNEWFGDLIYSVFSMARTRNCLMIISYKIASNKEVQSIVDKINKDNPIGTWENIAPSKIQEISNNMYKTIYTQLVSKNPKVIKNIELIKQLMINLEN